MFVSRVLLWMDCTHRSKPPSHAPFVLSEEEKAALDDEEKQLQKEEFQNAPLFIRVLLRLL